VYYSRFYHGIWLIDLMLWTHLICSNRPHKSRLLLCIKDPSFRLQEVGCCVRYGLLILWVWDEPMWRPEAPNSSADCRTASNFKTRSSTALSMMFSWYQWTAKLQHLQANSCVEGVDGTVHRHRSVPWPDGWWHPPRHQDRWATDGSSSRSLWSNSCVKQLQHPPTIVDNQDEGWRGERWNIVHLPTEHLTGQRWYFWAARLSTTTAWTDTIILCV
jgi:hypothetical protein